VVGMVVGMVEDNWKLSYMTVGTCSVEEARCNMLLG